MLYQDVPCCYGMLGSVLDLLKKGLEEADKLKFNQQIKEKV